jgi:uncharacterized protein
MLSESQFKRNSVEQDRVRIGDYLEVFSGGRFYPLDPREDEIHIEDIAHALALTCRFSGHTRTFYSVAEHSVRVSHAVEIHAQREGCENDREIALWGLLHDASEAYLNDIPRPLKRAPIFWIYRVVEANLTGCILKKFGIPYQSDWDDAPLTRDNPEPFRVPIVPQLVHDADEILLATEARDLMTPGALDRWTPFRFQSQPNPIVPWSWDYAEEQFLLRFEELTR